MSVDLLNVDRLRGLGNLFRPAYPGVAIELTLRRATAVSVARRSKRPRVVTHASREVPEGVLTMQAARGLPAETAHQIRIPVGQGLIGQLAQPGARTSVLADGASVLLPSLISIKAALLVALRDYTGERGTRFSVAVIHGRQPGPRLPWLTQFLADESIPFLLYNQHGSRWRARSLYVDPHLNPYGHRLLARRVAELLDRS